MNRTCQYCGTPSGDSYTCEFHERTFNPDACRCENNGDYCESCQMWVDSTPDALDVVREAEESEMNK